MMRWFLIVLVLLTACGDQKRKLYVYTWSEMFDPDLIREFEQNCECRVILDTYDSNEMLYAKLKSGAGGYDLIVPTYYFEQLMVKQNMLEPIDLSKIPNIKYLDRSLLKPIDKTLLLYSVPFSISYTGIGFRKDRIARLEDTWCVFGDSRYRGRMTLLNDYRETLGIALLCLGFNPNTLNPEEIDRAADLVIEWKKNIAKFENEQYKNGIATAEFLIVQGYSSDILQVSRENPDVVFSFPKEGALVSFDQFAIPRGARNQDLAYAFINFIFEPRVSAENMKLISLRIPNQEAYQYLPKKMLESLALFPGEKIVSKLVPIEDLGEDVRLYQQAWEKVKESR